MLVHKIKLDSGLFVHVYTVNISTWKKTSKSQVKLFLCGLEEHVRWSFLNVKKKKKTYCCFPASFKTVGYGASVVLFFHIEVSQSCENEQCYYRLLFFSCDKGEGFGFFGFFNQSQVH